MDPHDQQRDRGYDAGDDTSPTVPTGVTEPEEATPTTHESVGELSSADRERFRESVRDSDRAPDVF